MKAQMGLPDMKLPIQYALTYPQRFETDFERFDFLNYPNLTFEKPDLDTFRNLQLAYDAMEKGGNLACVLNAANEVTVEAFLKDKIKFLDIAEINEKVLSTANFIGNPTLDALYQTDLEARNLAQQFILKF
jgi:1-deoxy-D-xylulose-5-phosphate reductoisomerase